MESKLWVRVVSDVHLEFRKLPLEQEGKWEALLPLGFDQASPRNPDLDSTLLVVAGDLGYPSSAAYSKYLRRARQRFDHVAVVAGNHESYMQKIPLGAFHGLPEAGSSEAGRCNLAQTSSKKSKVSPAWSDARAREACEREDCFFLQKDVATITLKDGSSVDVAGCTLWSHVPEERRVQAEEELNDFHHLLDEVGRPLCVETYNAMHADHVAWLERILARPQPPAIVVTHHLPTSLLLHPKYGDNALNCCFASDTLSRAALAIPKLWCAGHSHSAVDLQRGRGRMVVNPMGYPTERTGYNPNLHHVLRGTS